MEKFEHIQTWWWTDNSTRCWTWWRFVLSVSVNLLISMLVHIQWPWLINCDCQSKVFAAVVTVYESAQFFSIAIKLKFNQKIYLFADVVWRSHSMMKLFVTVRMNNRGLAFKRLNTLQNYLQILLNMGKFTNFFSLSTSLVE